MSLFNEKDQKTGLDFPLSSLRFPKSDRLLENEISSSIDSSQFDWWQIWIIYPMRTSNHSPLIPVAQGSAALKAIDLSKTYHAGDVDIHALRQVSIELFESELVVLLGPSGSGKSTLLNILGGLDTPTGGEFYFRGQRMDSADDKLLTRFRRDHVGFVFQFYNLIASLTAAENISLVTEIAQKPLTPQQALAMVGLEDRADAFPSQLSGGEQQRVAIARAIAKQPDILLCDEPTGALDSKTGILVLKAIAKVNSELGTTTALITHNAGIAAMADRVIRFGDGQIIEIAENRERASPDDLQW